LKKNKERTPEGNPTGTNIDGDAHAKFYYELANKVEQGEYVQTFVKGKAYVKFQGKGQWWNQAVSNLIPDLNMIPATYMHQNDCISAHSQPRTDMPVTVQATRHERHALH